MRFDEEIRALKRRIGELTTYIHAGNGDKTISDYSKAVRDLAEAISYLTKSEDPFNE